MKRRTFVRLGSGVLASGALRSDASARSGMGKSGAGMKVGTQHSSSDEVLEVLSALSVNHICSSLPSTKMDQAWSVDGLKRLRERVESYGIALEMVPLPLSSYYITSAELPNILLARVPSATAKLTISVK